MGHYFINDDNLEHDIKKINVTIKNKNFYYYTDNGVFSKNEIDFGTKLLLESFILNNNTKTVLDIGCGCGPIGLYLSKLGLNVDMCDINERAINLVKKAKEEQKINVNVFESDAYLSITNKYDCIISNPPIRVGKEKLYEIIMNSVKYLNKNGEVWLVVRKDKGANSLVKDMKQVFNDVKIVNKKKGFYIIYAEK